jgi:hypothetical protein
VPWTVFAGRFSASPPDVRISLHSDATAPMSRRDRMISFAIDVGTRKPPAVVVPFDSARCSSTSRSATVGVPM